MVSMFPYCMIFADGTHQTALQSTVLSSKLMYEAIVLAYIQSSIHVQIHAEPLMKYVSDCSIA